MNPFGPTTQKPLELRKFDSAAEQISTVANKVSSSDREQQSVIEQVRQIALNILSDTVDAISENQLEEDEMGIDYLDGLIIDALGDANDAIYENALMSSLSDAFNIWGSGY